MKRLKTLSFAILVICSFVSCTLDTSTNGDLDGYWHLKSVDTVATNGSTDLREKRVFWSFQHKLLQLVDRDSLLTSCLLRFEMTTTTLRIYSPYLFNREKGDQPLEDPTLLKPFGISLIDETFLIEKLTGSKMVLLSATYRLTFEKF